VRLTWSARANADRREIRHYIAADNPAAAIKLDTLLEHRADSLREHPFLGRPGRLPGTRELLAHRHYLLIYDLHDDQVRILRVMHSARRWPPHTP